MSEKLRIASIFIDLVKAEEKPFGKRRYEYDLYCYKDGNFPISVFMLLTVPCVYRDHCWSVGSQALDWNRNSAVQTLVSVKT